ncbi:hypothetical protein Tco_1164338, partial [Tanacetum coccineum]
DVVEDLACDGGGVAYLEAGDCSPDIWGRRTRESGGL